MNFHKVLGIPHNADERTLKRAYSTLIKQYRPDTHPAEFAEVREAYEAAMQAFRHRRRREDEQHDFTTKEPAAERVANTGSPDTETPGDREFKRVADEPPTLQTGDRAFPDAIDDHLDPFERVLTEPPVLTHADAAPEDQAPRDFERVVTEPPVQPPFDPPPVDDVATIHVTGDVEALTDMLAEFGDHADKASEDEQLHRYRAHARTLAEWPLDFQMDYEQGLLSWLLFSDNPSLLVFQEADRRYDWESASMDIMRSHGNGARQRYAALKQLAALFTAARAGRNPFLLLDGVAKRRAIPIDDYYSALRAQEHSAAWKRACQETGLAQLSTRVAYAENRHWRIYWLDVMIGFLAAWIAWVPLDIDPKPFMWPRVALVGVASLLVIAGVRGVVLWVRAKLHPLTSRYKAWWRESVADKGQAFGTGLAVLLMVSFVVTKVPAVAGVLGVAMMSYLFSFFYRALTILEIIATRMVIRLARIAGWLRRTLAPS